MSLTEEQQKLVKTLAAPGWKFWIGQKGRDYAASKLGETGSEEAVEPLLAELKKGKPSEAILEAVQKLGKAPDRFVQALADAFLEDHQSDPGLAKTILKALASFGTEVDHAIDRIVEGVYRSLSNEIVTIGSTRGMAGVTVGVVNQALFHAFREQGISVEVVLLTTARWNESECYIELGTSTSFIAESLGDATVVLLKKCGAPGRKKAVGALAGRLKHEKNLEVRAMIVEVLANMAREGFPPPPGAEAALVALQQDTAKIRADKMLERKLTKLGKIVAGLMGGRPEVDGPKAKRIFLDHKVHPIEEAVEFLLGRLPH